MSPSPEHEQVKETISLLVNMLVDESCVNVEGFGSMTSGEKTSGEASNQMPVLY